jgi:hypothetical protein
VASEATADGLVEIERAAGNPVASAADDIGLSAPRRRRERVEACRCAGSTVVLSIVVMRSLIAAFERSVDGDKSDVREDADLVSQDVDIEDATTGGVRHAVEIAADAHHDGAAARRGARRVKLNLRRGDVDTGPHRLDRFAHVHLRSSGGVAAMLVSDDLKSGVGASAYARRHKSWRAAGCRRRRESSLGVSPLPQDDFDQR